MFWRAFFLVFCTEGRSDCYNCSLGFVHEEWVISPDEESGQLSTRKD